MNKKVGTVEYFGMQLLLVDRVGRVYLIENPEILEPEDENKKFYYIINGTKCTIERIT